MNEVVVEELSAKAMIEEVIAEVQSEFSKKSAEERAFILIKGFFDIAEQSWDDGEEMSDKLVSDFQSWFNDPRNGAAIEKAMDRLIKMDEERLREFGFLGNKSSYSSDDEQDMPDIGRLTQIFGNNRTAI